MDTLTLLLQPSKKERKRKKVLNSTNKKKKDKVLGKILLKNPAKVYILKTKDKNVEI